MIERILWFVTVFVSICFFAWYISAILLFVGFLVFETYYEGVFLALLYDLIYVSGAFDGSMPMWFFVAIALFYLSVFIRPLVRYNT